MESRPNGDAKESSQAKRKPTSEIQKPDTTKLQHLAQESVLYIKEKTGAVRLSPALFKYGIVAIEPRSIESDKVFVTDNTFTLSNRKCVIYDESRSYESRDMLKMELETAQAKTQDQANELAATTGTLKPAAAPDVSASLEVTEPEITNVVTSSLQMAEKTVTDATIAKAGKVTRTAAHPATLTHAINLRAKLAEFASDIVKEDISVELHSQMPEHTKLKANTYLLIRDKSSPTQWQLYYVNENNSVNLIKTTNIAALSYLDGAIKNLPRNKNPEVITAQEKATILSALRAYHQKLYIHVPEHKEEIFLPLTLSSTVGEETENTGLYVYPWLGGKENDNFKFDGFNNFVVAGCMFGAQLRGKDENNFSAALLKHNIVFSGPDQKIKYIDFDAANPNPYEDFLFHEFEKYAHLISTLSATKPAKLTYHLPYYDYILFGVELFIRGRITLAALDSLFSKFYDGMNEHVSRIRQICDSHQIDVTIKSPYCNLFNAGDNQQLTAREVLERLNIPVAEVDPRIPADQQKKNEANLVHACLEILQTNDANPRFAQVWKDFVLLTGKEKITNLEELFKIGNAVMLGVSVDTPKDAKAPATAFKTCSLLPLSEKQIQVSYAAIRDIDKCIRKLKHDSVELQKKLDEAEQQIRLQEEIANHIQKLQTLQKRVRTKPEASPDVISIDQPKNEELKADQLLLTTQKDALQKKIDVLTKRKATLEASYPPIFNLSVLDSMLMYGPQNPGLAFYDGGSPAVVSELITKMSILDQAQKHIGRFGLYARNKNVETAPVKSLDDFLAESIIPRKLVKTK